MSLHRLLELVELKPNLSLGVLAQACDPSTLALGWDSLGYRVGSYL